ncbi:unnamed protein product [Diabrotica balteata]|uniref:Uncharacterized protein n=1 Tax=Diabrotica balteata TaxID=107213 RepID=A0A9N9SWC4_DIABA|nr:unnamed protein product [Diabrotica balteata]
MSTKILIVDILSTEIVNILKYQLKIVSKTSKLIVVETTICKCKGPWNVQDIIMSYKRIQQAVVDYNTVFSKIILIRISTVFVGCLKSMSYMFFGFSKESTENGNDVVCEIFRGSYIFISLCFVVRCIISCENVEKAGEKLGTLCKILQSEVQEPRLKEQLIDMSTLIAALPLSFSISGFFKINKRLIPSLISGITSYLIILIQFKAQDQCS